MARKNDDARIHKSAEGASREAERIMRAHEVAIGGLTTAIARQLDQEQVNRAARALRVLLKPNIPPQGPVGIRHMHAASRLMGTLRHWALMLEMQQPPETAAAEIIEAL